MYYFRKKVNNNLNKVIIIKKKISNKVYNKVL